MWLTESIATWEAKKSDSTRIRIKNFGPARPLANPPLGLCPKTGRHIAKTGRHIAVYICILMVIL